jgi:hypothetical protein
MMILGKIFTGFIVLLAIPFAVYAQEGVVVSYDGYAGFQGPLWAAKELELFRKHDLKAVYANRLRQQDLKVLDSTYDYFAPKFSFPPWVDRDGIRNALELVSDRDRDAKGEINVEQFIDEV